MAYARAVGEYQPPPAPATEAVPEAEGLRLHLSSSNATGYMGVYTATAWGGRFQASRCYNGGRQVIGNFATAVEAAVAYARAVGQAESAGAEEGRAVGRKRARGRGGWRGGGGGGGTLSQLGCHIGQHSPLPQCPKARRGYGLRRGRSSLAVVA